VSKYEIKVTFSVGGEPVSEVVAGYGSVVDFGVAMQNIGQALRPDAEGRPASCPSPPTGAITRQP
jgi:hypothetical protein